MTQLDTRLSPIEITDLAIAEDTIRAGLDSFVRVGEALARIRDGRLYRGTHETFAAYCEDRWKMGRSHAYRMIDASEVAANLSPMGDTVPAPTSERQLRPLVGMSPDLQREAYLRAAETAPDGKLTAAHVEKVAHEIAEVEFIETPEPKLEPKIHANPILTSKSNEWYTPEIYVEAARDVMGSIDVDPASCAQANLTVRAATFYTIEDDGLGRDWPGNVWLNPPYGTDDTGASNAGRWAACLIRQYQEAIARQGIVCVNALTCAPWFQQLWDFTICFTNHRVHFDAPVGSDAPSRPMNGTAFVYLGPNPKKFAERYSEFGAIVRRFP